MGKKEWIFKKYFFTAKAQRAQRKNMDCIKYFMGILKFIEIFFASFASLRLNALHFIHG